MKGLNYREAFGTTEELTSFVNYFRENGGNSNYKVSTEYQGKRLHSAVAVSLDILSRELQRQLVKSVSVRFRSIVIPNITFCASLYERT